MARIPEQDIERLRQEISLQRLAEARGVKLAVYSIFGKVRERAVVIAQTPESWRHRPTLDTRSVW